MVALVLACLTVITLDFHGGVDSPMEPARQAVGEVLGPIETGTTTLVRPFTAVPDWFRSRSALRDDVEPAGGRERPAAHRGRHRRTSTATGWRSSRA